MYAKEEQALIDRKGKKNEEMRDLIHRELNPQRGVVHPMEPEGLCEDLGAFNKTVLVEGWKMYKLRK